MDFLGLEKDDYKGENYAKIWRTCAHILALIFWLDFYIKIWYYVYRWRKLHTIKKGTLDTLCWVQPYFIQPPKSIAELGGRFYFASIVTESSKIIMINEKIKRSFLNTTITSLPSEFPEKKKGHTQLSNIPINIISIVIIYVNILVRLLPRFFW